MTDWKKVRGSQSEKPSEFDTTTSSVIIYQRKNIESITIENMDGTTVDLWEYDERTMSPEEYNTVRGDIMQAEIAQNRADIDFISAMTDIEL